MLTLAGTHLLVPTRNVIDWVRRNIHPRDICPWSYRAFPGPRLGGLTLPTGFELPREVRLNTFSWPQGASRWATGYFLASTDQVSEIRDVAFGEDGKETKPITLHMSVDGLRTRGGESGDDVVETEVYLMPPYPLGRADPVGFKSVNGLYLLVVVDARYYWWSKPVEDMAIDGVATTWAQAYDKVGDALGVEIEADEIHADYLKPNKSLSHRYEATPLILDAIAYNVGQRIVRDLDGKVRALNADNTRRRDDDDSHPKRTLRAGGDLFRETL